MLEEAPVELEKEPAGHSVQFEVPATAAYVPCRHALHVALLVALKTLEEVPTGHSIHQLPAGRSIYEPTWHPTMFTWNDSSLNPRLIATV